MYFETFFVAKNLNKEHLMKGFKSNISEGRGGYYISRKVYF